MPDGQDFEHGDKIERKQMNDLTTEKADLPVRVIENRILLVRTEKVMLDEDLAELYQVPTKRLNEAVRRNRDRFPEDFMFRLTQEEAHVLRSQIATSKAGRGGRRYMPYVFTEQGIAMLSSVLSSKRAIQVNIAIMRAFVRLRQLLATHEELAQRLNELERHQLDQNYRIDQHQQQIEAVFAAIEEMIATSPDPPKRRIGFPAADEPAQ